MTTPTPRGQLLRDAALRSAALAAFVFAWWAVARAGVWNDKILPSPGAVWDRFVQSISTDERGRKGIYNHYLWEHLWASLWRVGLGVFWALVVGVPLGLAIAFLRPVRIVMEPVVDFLRALPPLAYFSLLVIWFGIENTPKIVLLALAALAPITLAIVSGVEGVRRDGVEAAQSLGASRFETVVHTVLPATLPELLTAFRVSVGFAFTTVVAAETIDGMPGIGGMAWATKKFLQTDTAIMAVIVIGVCAVLIDRLIRMVERRLVPWKGRV